MNIIKRNGTEVEFDISKVVKAITAACEAVEDDFMDDEEIAGMAAIVQERCTLLSHTPSVEEISDMVEYLLMDSHKKSKRLIFSR